MLQFIFPQKCKIANTQKRKGEYLQVCWFQDCQLLMRSNEEVHK